jgi:hypothetical protein
MIGVFRGLLRGGWNGLPDATIAELLLTASRRL